jgi:hypothetical protein
MTQTASAMARGHLISCRHCHGSGQVYKKKSDISELLFLGVIFALIALCVFAYLYIIHIRK